MYEILIDGVTMYSVENETPAVYKNVRAEIANGIQASKVSYFS